MECLPRLAGLSTQQWHTVNGCFAHSKGAYHAEHLSRIAPSAANCHAQLESSGKQLMRAVWLLPCMS
jgi:hypothetical protein